MYLKYTFKTVMLALVGLIFISFHLNGQEMQPQFSTAGYWQVKDSPREIYNFNPGWRFFKGDISGAEQPSFDDRDWEAANLPHGLEILGENASGGRNYQGIAWYRKQFQITTQKKGRVFLYFEAVMGKCTVYVNGLKMTEHYGGYLPFAIDITEVLKKDRNNIVAVKADNRDDKTYPPGRNQKRLDFTYMGGIYRDCYLIQTSDVHLSFPELSKTVAGGGVFAATLDINGHTAKMEVRTEVKNTSDRPQNIKVETTLEDADFKTLKIVTEQTTLPAGDIRQMASQFSAEKVHLWHPDDPYLHFIKTSVFADGVLVDQMRTRIGIRLFEMRGADGLFINKQPYTDKLIGVNRHQDYTYIGNALPNNLHWRDVKILREGGSRIIRVGHYPQDPAFYDACDQLGMLTTTANPGWHFYNFKNPVFEKRLYEDTRNLVRADRNRPSILLWETALNETPEQPDHAMRNMHLAAHEEFPFPGMYTVTDHQEAKKGGLDMYYHGNDPNINSFNREYGDGGEVDNWKSQNARTRVNMAWGEHALLEMALMQAEELSDRYPTPKVRIGGAKWAGIDHQRGYHPDPFWGGLLDGVRSPKYIYHLYKSQYDADYKVKGIQTGPMLFNCHELTQISPDDVVIFSNCDQVRLTWLGEEIALLEPSADPLYKDLPHPPFIFKNTFNFDIIKKDWRRKTKKIQMIAEGLIDGKVVIKDVKDYAERTAAVSLSLADEGVSLVADGSDIMTVRATIVDEEGSKKVLADHRIYFEVEGPAEIIGGPYNQGNPVNTTFGIATALVKATTETGPITILAYVDGLASDSLKLMSVKPSQELLYDQQYLSASKFPEDKLIINLPENIKTDLPADVLKLQKEVEQLRLELTGRDQDIMELRGKLKKQD